MPSTNPTATSTRVLLVSAAAERRQLWAQLLRQHFPEVDCLVAHDGASALYQGTQRPLVSAIIDSDLPDMDGALISAGLRSLQPQLAILTIAQAASAPCLNSPTTTHACDGFNPDRHTGMNQALVGIFSCRCFAAASRETASTRNAAITPAHDGDHELNS